MTRLRLAQPTVRLSLHQPSVRLTLGERVGDPAPINPELYAVSGHGSLAALDVLAGSGAVLGCEAVQGAGVVGEVAAYGSLPGMAVLLPADGAGSVGGIAFHATGAVALSSVQGSASLGGVAASSSIIATAAAVAGLGSVASVGAVGGLRVPLNPATGTGAVAAVSASTGISVQTSIAAVSASGSVASLSVSGIGRAGAMAATGTGAVALLGHGNFVRLAAVQRTGSVGALAFVSAYETAVAALPAPEPGKYVGWNSTGTALVNYTASEMLALVEGTGPKAGETYWIDTSGA